MSFQAVEPEIELVVSHFGFLNPKGIPAQSPWLRRLVITHTFFNVASMFLSPLAKPTENGESSLNTHPAVGLAKRPGVRPVLWRFSPTNGKISKTVNPGQVASEEKLHLPRKNVDKDKGCETGATMGHRGHFESKQNIVPLLEFLNGPEAANHSPAPGGEGRDEGGHKPLPKGLISI